MKIARSNNTFLAEYKLKDCKTKTKQKTFHVEKVLLYVVCDYTNK